MHHETLKTFRERITARRREMGVCQSYVKKNTGVPIENLEKGDVSPDVTDLVELASFYEESIDYFLGVHDIKSDTIPDHVHDDSGE